MPDPLHLPAGSDGLLGPLARVALDVQRQRTEEEIFRALGQQLLPLGIRSVVCEIEGDHYRIRHIAARPDRLADVERLAGAPLTSLRFKFNDERARAAYAGRPTFADGFDGRSFESPSAAARADESGAALRGVWAPLPRDRKPWGLLLVYGETLTSADVDTVAMFAAAVASALDTVRLVDDLERKNRELALLHAVARACTRLEVTRSADEAISQVVALLPARAACLHLKDRDSGKLVPVAHAGMPEGVAESDLVLTVTDPFFRRLLETGEALSEATERLDPPVRRLCEQLGIAHVAGAPLFVKGEAAGILVAGRTEASGFPSCAVGLLSNVAAMLAVAADNARLYDEVRRRVQDLTLLAEVSEAVTGSLDLERTFDTAARRMAQIVDASNAFIILYDEHERALRGVATSLPGGLDRPVRIGVDQVSLAAR